jgi:hypothetical protein
MIENFRIEGYRGLRDLELPDLGQLNLVIGPNGAGKSTVLESLFAFSIEGQAHHALRFVPLDENEPAPAVIREGFSWLIHRVGPRDIENRTKAVFRGRWNGIERSVVLSIERRLRAGLVSRSFLEAAVERAGAASNAESFAEIREAADTLVSLDTLHGESRSTGELAFVADHPPVVRELRSQPAFTCLRLQFVAGRLRADRISQLVEEAILKGRLSRVLELLRLYDSELEDLRIGVSPGANATPVPRLVHRRLGQAPLSLMGTGFYAVATLALELATTDATVVLLDELDSSLHVSLIDKTLRWISAVARERGIQVFVASHRGDTVERLLVLAEEERLDARIIQLRKEDGTISAKTLTMPSARTLALEIGFDLRQPV